MTFKIVNNMVPKSYLSSHFVFRSDTLTYNLRHSDFSPCHPTTPHKLYCKKKSVVQHSLIQVSFCFYTRLPCEAGFFYHFFYCSSYPGSEPGFSFRLSFFFLRSVTNRHLVSTAHASLMQAYGVAYGM